MSSSAEKKFFVTLLYIASFIVGGYLAGISSLQSFSLERLSLSLVFAGGILVIEGLGQRYLVSDPVGAPIVKSGLGIASVGAVGYGLLFVLY